MSLNMNELAAYQQSDLPAQPADLARFMIVAQEKVKAVKAEIRAIQKLKLAKEVYAQKMEEQRRLQEVILLAYQRMGEITREMPKSSGNQYTSAFSHKREEAQPKSKAIRELGFSKDQVSRMEQMAAHPEIVEEVIAESQAGQTEATQGEVLRRIKERENIIDLADVRKEQFDQNRAQIEADAKLARAFVKATHAPLELAEDLDSVAAAIWRNADGAVQSDIEDIDLAVQALSTIKTKLINGRRLYGSL